MNTPHFINGIRIIEPRVFWSDFIASQVPFRLVITGIQNDIKGIPITVLPFALPFIGIARNNAAFTTSSVIAII